MGNADSTDGKKKGQSDDGCIGNRRVRTIILAILFCIFFIFAIPMAQAWEEVYRDIADACQAAFDLLPGDDDSACAIVVDAANAWAFVMTGCFVTIVGCILAVLLFIIPNCENTLGRVAGAVLIVGAVLYLIGWIWWISILRPSDDAYDALSDEGKQQLDARLAALFGEALLAGGAAVLLGLDALLQIFENEGFRLASNLGLIMVVAALCTNGYYLLVCGDDTLCVQHDGVEAIATGYLILFITCLVYVILFICTCCTCDCKDNCLIRVVVAVFLVIGGILCAIGYYVFSGADADTDTDDIVGKVIVYFVGYTILIGGLCVVWALDISLDDVKNRNETNKK